MKSFVAFILSFGMALGPAAHAQIGSKDNSVILQYQKAQNVYLKKGSLAFAQSFSYLTPSDQRYVASQMASRSKLPEVKLVGHQLTMTFDNTPVVFDLSHIQDGYVTFKGTKIYANFGGSVEEIAASLQGALEKAYPQQFSKKVSWLNIDHWLSVIEPSAYAVPSGLVWGGLAAVLAALVFKGVYDSRQKESKALASAKPAYIPEPTYEYPPPAAAASNPPASRHTGYLDYGANLRGPNVSRDTPPPADDGAPGEDQPNDDGGSDTTPLPDKQADVEHLLKILDGNKDKKPTAPSNSESKKPEEVVSVPGEDYKHYKSILCERGEDSIASLMEGLLKKIKENATFRKAESVSFDESRRQFVKAVLKKLQSLSQSNDKAKASTTEAYLNYVNRNFRLNLSAEKAKNIDVEKVSSEMDREGAKKVSIVVNADASVFETSFSNGSPRIFFDKNDGSIKWMTNSGAEKETVCKLPDVKPTPAATPANPAGVIIPTAAASSPKSEPSSSDLPPPYIESGD